MAQRYYIRDQRASSRRGISSVFLSTVSRCFRRPAVAVSQTQEEVTRLSRRVVSISARRRQDYGIRYRSAGTWSLRGKLLNGRPGKERWADAYVERV